MINSLHKQFNTQTNYISIGNVSSNTQHSSYVRNYEKYPEGFNFDMKGFKQFNFDEHLLKRIKKMSIENDGVIFYAFFHMNMRSNFRIIHGIVVCNNGHKVLYFEPFNNTQKSESVLKECIKILSKLS